MRLALIHRAIGGPSGGGGGVRQMMELARSLRALDHDIVVCCHSFDAPTALTEPGDDFEIRYVVEGVVPPVRTLFEAQRRRWRDLPAVARLVPADVDVINPHEDPANIIGYLAAKRLNKPWVWTRNDGAYYEIGLMPEQNPLGAISRRQQLFARMFDRIDLKAGRHADAISVLDSRNAWMVEQNYGRTAEIIRSGPALKFFEPRDRASARASLGLADTDFLALTVGILVPYRRFEDMITAVAIAGERIPEGRTMRAVVVGANTLRPDYGEQLSALRTELGLEGVCELEFESVPDERLQNLYAAADAFVFPNETQTWGLAPLEALAGGTPVIVSRGVGAHEVLEGFNGVHIVDPRNPEQIASALIEMAAAPPEDVSEAREWIRTELSGTAYAERMAELMASLIR